MHGKWQHWALAAMCLPLLAGCTKRGPDPATLKMLRGAGDGACLTALLRPERWAQATATLAPLLAAVEHPALRPVLAAPDPYAAFRALVAHTAPQAQLPAALAGWDQRRPLVAALFIPQLNDLVLAARSVLPLTFERIRDQGVPPLRHRLLIPATDSRALAESLLAVFEAADFVTPAAALKLAQGPRRHLLIGPGGLAALALVAEPDWVRVELAYQGHPFDPDAEARLARYAEMLAAPPAPQDRFDSPAWRLAAAGGHLAALHVRPWKLRDLASHIGAGHLVRAVLMADAAHQQMLLARGLAEVANASLLMSPEGAEIEDLAVAWDLDGGLRALVAASLSEHGWQVWRAGLKAGRLPPMPVADEALAWMWSRADLNTLLSSAGSLPALAQAREPDEALRAIQQCGFFCPLHLLLRAPLGACRTALDFVPVDLSNKLPRGLSLTLLDLHPGEPSRPVSAAVAALMRPGFNTQPLRAALGELERQMLHGARFDLRTGARGREELVSLTLGVDADEAFASSPDAEDNVLGAGRIDLQRLIAATGLQPKIAAQAPPAAAALKRLGSWRWRSRLVERALVGESLLELDPQREPAAWTDSDTLATAEWHNGAPAPELSRGQRCLRRVTRGMIQAFGALAAVAPEQRELMLAQAVEEVQGDLDCAAEQADTRQRAERTREVMALFLADRLTAAFHRQAALEVLDRACQQDHPRCCQRAERVRASPRVELARAQAPCSRAAGWGQPVVRIDATSTIDDLTERLKRSPSGKAPALAIDPQTSWSEVHPALAALAESGVAEVGLVVDTERGGPGLLTLQQAGVEPRQGPAGPPGIPNRFERLRIEPERDRKPHPLLVSVEPERVRLLAEGRVVELPQLPECKPGEICSDLEHLAELLQQLDADYGDSLQLKLFIAPATPFAAVARVLGTLLCSEKRRGYGSVPMRPVELLSAEAAEAFEQAAAAAPETDEGRDEKKAAEADKRTGVLKLLGSTSGQGRIANVFAAGAPPAGALDDALSDMDGADMGRFGVGGLGTAGSGKKSAAGGGKAGVKQGKPVVMGSMAKEVIRRVIRKHRNEVRYCYEKHLLAEPKLSGEATVKFVIGTSGKVQTAAIHSSSLGNKSLEKCVLSAIRRWTFPAPDGGIVVVRYPFLFRAAD